MCSPSRVGRDVELVGVCHVKFDDRCPAGQPPRDSFRDLQAAAEAGQDDLGALFLGHPGHGVGDRRLGEDPGHQQPLAGEQMGASDSPGAVDVGPQRCSSGW